METLKDKIKKAVMSYSNDLIISDTLKSELIAHDILEMMGIDEDISNMNFDDIKIEVTQK